MNKISKRIIAIFLVFAFLGTFHIPAFAEGAIHLQITGPEGIVLDEAADTEQMLPEDETMETEVPLTPSLAPEEIPNEFPAPPEKTPNLPEESPALPEETANTQQIGPPAAEKSPQPEPETTPEPEMTVQPEVRCVLVQYIDQEGERLPGETTVLNDLTDKVRVEDGVCVEDYIKQSRQQNTNIKWIQPDYIAELASVAENWCFSNTEMKNTLKVPLEEYHSSQISKEMLTEQYAACSNFSLAMQSSAGSGVSVGIIDNAGNEPTVENWHGRMIRNIFEHIVPEARLVNFNVFQNGKAYTSEIIRAIEQCKQEGVKIVNCSWTIEGQCPVLEEIIRSSDMLFVCAAGNQRSNLEEKDVSPASIKADNVITVASAAQDGQLSRFSNYSNRKVDIAAQGTRVTAAISETENYTSDGTSFAAAFVAGAAALAAGCYPNEASDRIRERILNSAVHFSELQKGVDEGRFLDCTHLLEDGYTDQEMILFRTTKQSQEQPAMLGQPEDLIISSKSNGWEECGTMQTARSDFDSVSYNGYVYLLGGQEQGGSEESALVERYTTADGTWQTLTPMPHARKNPQIAELDGKIYVLGGTVNGVWSRKLDVYDIASDTWSSLEDYPFENEFYAVCENRLVGKIYAIGGSTTAVYCMEPQTMQWEQLPSLMQYLGSVKAVYMGNGRICVTDEGSGNSLIYDNGYQEMDWIYNLSNYGIISVPDNTTEQDWRLFITGGKIFGTSPAGTLSNQMQVRCEEETFDDKRLQWFGAQALPVRLANHGMGQDGQYVYVLGGLMEQGEYNTHIYRLRADAKIDDDGYTVTTDEWAFGTINYLGDRDDYTFVPSVTGVYTIDVETENGILPRKYDKNGVGGDLLEQYIGVCIAGETISFTIEGAYSDEEVGRYLFRFRLLEEDLSKIIELPLNQTVTVTKPKGFKEPQYFAIPQGQNLYLGIDEEVSLETFMFRRNKQWLDKGVHKVSLNNVYDYICIGNDGNWSGSQTYTLGVFDDEHIPGEHETLAHARNKARAVTNGTDLYLIGGYENGVLNTVEKRVEGQWQEVTQMKHPSLGFGAAMMDGKIYIAGGILAGDCTSTLQIYDIQSGKWTLGANMPEARERLSMAAADGKLYAVGGRNPKGDCTSVLVYDAASNAWSNAGNIPQALLEPGVEVINNVLYLFGGFDENGEWTADMYTAELPSMTWQHIECPLTQAENVSLCKQGTDLYIVRAAYGVLTVYCYDTLSKQWSPEGSAYLFEDARYAAVNLLDDTFYFMGGYTKNYSDRAVKINLMDVYFPSDWSLHSEMLEEKNKTEAFVIDGEIYSMGGFSDGKPNVQIEKYNNSLISWQKVGEMPYFYPSSGFCTVNKDHKIYMIGGHRNGQILQQLWIYDMDQGKWDDVKPMLEARERAGAVLDEADEKIYVFGGQGKYGALDTIEQYDIKTGVWKMVGTMPEARMGFGISKVGEQVLIVGGYNETGDVTTTSLLYDLSTGKWRAPQEVPGLTEHDYVTGVKGTPNGVFGFKRIGGWGLRTAEYDFEQEQWLPCELNGNLPDYDYFSLVANEENIYCLGGYSYRKKANSNEVYLFPYQVRRQEPSGMRKTVYVEQGKEYQIAFSVQAMEEMGSQECVLQYDSDFCEILDLNSQTPETDLKTGAVEGSSLVVTSFENGCVTFRVNKPVFVGKTYSGLVNTVSFRAKQTGSCMIKGKVRRES